MEVATWKVKGIFKADAEKVHQEIGDNGITPEEMVDKGRDESTELHKCFEWDDAIAGEKYRIHQAENILRLLVVEVKGDDEEQDSQKFRIYQSSSTVREYQPTKFFKQNKDEYQKLLDKAKAELISFRNRYESLAEMDVVIEAINSVI